MLYIHTKFDLELVYCLQQCSLRLASFQWSKLQASIVQWSKLQASIVTCSYLQLQSLDSPYLWLYRQLYITLNSYTLTWGQQQIKLSWTNSTVFVTELLFHANITEIWKDLSRCMLQLLKFFGAKIIVYSITGLFCACIMHGGRTMHAPCMEW